eukprot:CAMPEP_0202343412 /NCGR_PEP_ID=MMETSP1126-20121109/3543_1 /ASSEMBLY_ACC=CAM_ASM_000457 /TAXON_ID=3047 /ORGANISM="Dunaliella tertiolecta, Strain CCMP1320" /LENGTH=1109 /DNA_ID=CAMNT_0048934475 /DNA_START=46 /DNA_END=3376 /DNA_ORIENTATION=-
MQVSASNKSLDGLLGAPGEGNLPHWLQPETFMLDNFKSELVVADLRRYVPLPSLQSELENYLATLKTKMVEVINADYSDYVSLSSKLVNVDGAVVRMRKPLIDLREKLQAIQGSVVGELTSLNQGLKRRKEVATARSLLDLMQQLAHIASKVEKLLAEVDALPPLAAGQAGGEGRQADLDVRARLLERVAGEVSRLTFQANRGKDLAFVRSMEPRISASRTHILTHLGPTMEAALTDDGVTSDSHNDNSNSKSGNSGGRRGASTGQVATLHCAHAYAELGETGPAEEALRTVVVAPIVASHLTAHLFNSILESVLARAGPLLSASLAPQSPLRSFDFLSNSVLAEVNESVSAAIPGAFSPGVPPAFHANYLAAQRFLDALEAQCHSRAALDRLRASPHYASFMKKWNTSIYFSLIYQDIAGELEDAVAVAKPDLKAPPSEPASVSLPPSVALVACLDRAAAPNVYLPQVADRFLRLTLQLGQRYKAWVASIVAARKDKAGPHPSAAPQTPSAAAAAPQMPSTPSTFPSSSLGPKQQPAGAATPQSPDKGQGSPSNTAWVVPLSIEEVMAVQQDMETAGAYLAEDFADMFVALLRQSLGSGEQQDHVYASAHAALQQLGKDIQAQAGELLGAACVEVVESCVSLVKQLKGITATYRMTSKGPPTRHSHYVTGVLGPLRAVLGHQISGPVAKRLAAAVVDAVTVRYKELAVELLTTVRKTESSLKRLKKARPGETEGGEGGGMSDSDKITLQLYLDVQEYGAQAAKFDLQPHLLPSFHALLEAVTPAPTVLQAAGLPPAAPSSSTSNSAAPSVGAAPATSAVGAAPSGNAACGAPTPSSGAAASVSAADQSVDPGAAPTYGTAPGSGSAAAAAVTTNPSNPQPGPAAATPGGMPSLTPSSIPGDPSHQQPAASAAPSSFSSSTAGHPFLTPSATAAPLPPPPPYSHGSNSVPENPHPFFPQGPPPQPHLGMSAHEPFLSSGAIVHPPQGTSGQQSFLPPGAPAHPPLAMPFHGAASSGSGPTPYAPTYSFPGHQQPPMPTPTGAAPMFPPSSGSLLFPGGAPQSHSEATGGGVGGEFGVGMQGPPQAQQVEELVRGEGGLRKQDAFACYTR